MRLQLGRQPEFKSRGWHDIRDAGIHRRRLFVIADPSRSGRPCLASAAWTIIWLWTHWDRVYACF